MQQAYLLYRWKSYTCHVSTSNRFKFYCKYLLCYFEYFYKYSEYWYQVLLEVQLVILEVILDVLHKILQVNGQYLNHFFMRPQVLLQVVKGMLQVYFHSTLKLFVLLFSYVYNPHSPSPYPHKKPPACPTPGISYYGNTCHPTLPSTSQTPV